MINMLLIKKNLFWTQWPLLNDTENKRIILQLKLVNVITLGQTKVITLVIVLSDITWNNPNNCLDGRPKFFPGEGKIFSGWNHDRYNHNGNKRISHYNHLKAFFQGPDNSSSPYLLVEVESLAIFESKDNCRKFMPPIFDYLQTETGCTKDQVIQ
jgi:hypothetical protein